MTMHIRWTFNGFPDRRCVREMREYLHIDAHHCGLCECKRYLIRLEFALPRRRARHILIFTLLLSKSSNYSLSVSTWSFLPGETFLLTKDSTLVSRVTLRVSRNLEGLLLYVLTLINVVEYPLFSPRKREIFHN